MTRKPFHPPRATPDETTPSSKGDSDMHRVRLQEAKPRRAPAMQVLAPPVAAPRMRYIGSKARIADAIVAKLGRPGLLVDACSGTGIVARTAAVAGWKVHINDHLSCATTMSLAQLCSHAEARFRSLGGYAKTIQTLDALPPQEGFIHAEYAPTQRSASGHERRYFTPHNAGRIDAVRQKIRMWAEDGTISPVEAGLLTADLISAANSVANISGTYGCFLRTYQASALQPLTLRCRPLMDAPVQAAVTNDDIFNLEVAAESTCYIDPPYTKRQYAAYYHILETIAVGDEPAVGGITGLRPWKEKDSPFCHRRRAAHAFNEAVGKLASQRIIISYSDEAHLNREELRQAVEGHGKVTFHDLGAVGRYRPNAVATQQGTVGEYLLELVK